MRNYQWPEVTRNMRRYVKGCDMYQMMKNRMKMPAGKLKLSEVSEKLWTYTAKMLYRQDDEKFKNKYLKRLEKNWEK